MESISSNNGSQQSIEPSFGTLLLDQDQTQKAFPFLTLPVELQVNTLKYTRLCDRKNIQLTCTTFKRIGNDRAVVSCQITNTLANRYPHIFQSELTLTESPGLKAKLSSTTEIDLTGKPKVQFALARYLRFAPENCTHTLRGHTGWVLCATVLPDGRLVSGSWDKTLKVWDPSRLGEADACTHTLRGHTDWVLCATVLPDGRLVSGSMDNTLKVWDPSRGEADACTHTLRGHTDWVRCATVLPVPDRRLVSGSVDNTLKVWDPSRLGEADACTHTLRGHTGGVWCATVLPDGRLVSGSGSGSWDNTLKVWDPSPGEADACTHTLRGHTGWVRCATVLPDGRLVSGSDDKTLKVWNPSRLGEADACTHTLRGHTGGVWCATVLPDGRLVSGSGSG